MADPTRTAVIIADLNRARSRVAANVHALRGDLEIGRKVRAGFEKNRFAWLGAAAGFGLVLAKIPARTKKIVVGSKARKDKQMETAGKAGLSLAVLKIVLDFLRPALTRWATQIISTYGGRRAGRRRPANPQPTSL